MYKLLQFLADNDFTLKVEHIDTPGLIITLSRPNSNFYCAFEIDITDDFDTFYTEYLGPVLNISQKVT